ncbi:uncharacterized protein DNG_09939 [Cephalotrichum gorgonifer]|uniref:Uncharacterized protein n=1 Tax=Cephalotrichum gorgonifer TaxID=2041049 RepID=A0AAE8SZV9_9PEZI|nr:uncharacterized protein DNG_09939 [Cephalotrichum gorgonifer]
MGLFGKKPSDSKGSPPPGDEKSDEKRMSSVSTSQNAVASGSNDPPPQYQPQHQPQAPPAEPSLAYAQSPGLAMQPLQPPPPGFQTRFACVSLNMSDRLRFLNFSPEDFQAAQEVVAASWPRGIRHVQEYGGAMEIKTRGNPWSADVWGAEDRDAAKRMLRRLLGMLYNRGWVLQASLDMSKKEFDKDTLIFRHQSPAPLPCDWLAVVFSRADRLRFIDPPPPDLAGAVLATFGHTVTKHEVVGGAFEVKFYGYPWAANGTDTVISRMMVLNLLSTMEGFGWTLYACVSQMASQDMREADVMYFQRRVDWVPGAPVLHR